jgi:predicted O-methyltransferase YrrM
VLISIKRKINNFFASRLTGVRKYLEYKSSAFWFDYPFGKQPRASIEEYFRLAKEVRLNDYPEIDEYEQKTGYFIDREWLHDLALHTQVVVKDSPLCYVHGRVLYSALSYYLQQHPPASPTDMVTIWETGTARGFSALCMAKALKDQQRVGTIVTFDVLPHRTSMYWNCIDDWDGIKTRAELLSPWRDLLQDYVFFHQGDTRLELPKIQAERINFAYLDGAHTYEDVMFEFEQIRERQQSGDMIIYDDYTPVQFPGLVKAVDEICRKYRYQRIEMQAHSCRGYVVAIKE